MHQLEEIIYVLGTPSDESLAFITNSMAKRAIMQVCAGGRGGVGAWFLCGGGVVDFFVVLFFVFSFGKTRFFQLPKRQRRPFSELFRGCNEQAVGLLERMLVFDPRERCTVDEALAHPYFQPLHDANEEPECKIPFDIQCERDYHGQEVPKDVIQNEVYRDMMRFHPEEKGMCDAYSNVKQQHRSKGGSRRK